VPDQGTRSLRRNLADGKYGARRNRCGCRPLRHLRTACAPAPGLGKLAPELLDAYRAGDISLDVVTAFTLGADHKAQLAVWNQLKANTYIQPYTVKRLLTESALPLDSSIGQFVGADTYEAAGGTITRDLFSGDEDGFMDDAALVRRLATEKLEAKAEELRAEWAWTRAVLEPEYRMLAQYARVEPKPAEVPTSPPKSSASSSASASSKTSTRINSPTN